MKKHAAKHRPAVIHWAEESDWVFEPQQARSRQSMRKTLDAAFRLFTEKGYEGTTIADIAGRAGIAAGSVYRRFPDKDSLLNAVADGYYLTRRREFDALVDDPLGRLASSREVLRVYTRIIFSAYRADTATVRLFERRALVDPPMAERVADNSRYVVHHVARVLARLDPRPLAQLERLMSQWHGILRGTLVHRILPDSPPDWPPPVLADPRFDAAMSRAALPWFRLHRRG